MALTIAALVVDDAALSIDAAGDDRNCPGSAQRQPQGIGVVALVAEDMTGLAGAGEEGWGGGYVRDVSSCQRESEGPTDGVGEGVDLGRLAAAREADRLIFRPPFPPKAERWALT